MEITQNDAKKALAKLFLCFPENGDENDRKMRRGAYWKALERLQPRFVIEACEYAAKGKVGDGRFLPTAAELFQSAEAFAARDAQRRKPRELSAPDMRFNDPATRQRIIEGFAKLLADLKSGKKIDPDRATREVFRK